MQRPAQHAATRTADATVWCSHTRSAVQAPTATSNSGPGTASAGDAAFAVTVNVTFAPGALLQPFSDPGAAAQGTVSLANAADGSAVPGVAEVSASGPGFVTFGFYPRQSSLGLGPHSVLATYTSSAAYLLGSTAPSAYSFTIGPVSASLNLGLRWPNCVSWHSIMDRACNPSHLCGMRSHDTASTQ